MERGKVVTDHAFVSTDRCLDFGPQDRQRHVAIVALHAGAVRNALQSCCCGPRRAPQESAGRLQPKQIVVAAMRKLLVLCFGVLKTGKRFDPAIAMPA
jgi:hypothetical protein